MKKVRIYLAQSWPGPSGPLKHISPPLGLLYIAAYLRERLPVEIRVTHQRLENLSSEQLVRQIIDFEPDIVGLGCMTPSAMLLPDITRAIRTARPDTLIILGGPHIAAAGETTLGQCDADLAVAGEGELVMEQVVQAWRDGADMAHIPGLIRKTADGDVVTNPGEAPIIEDLDTLPMPAYDLIDIRAFRRRHSFVPIPNRNYLSLFSSRGCPYGCIYCHNVFRRKFRMHSPERMVEEIKCFGARFGVDEFEFYDDCFNLNRERVISFSERLIKEVGPVKLAFPNALRADLLDADAVGALKQAGMYYTALALESGSPRIQELIGKRLDIDKYLEAADLCAGHGVFTNGFAMLGFPTETAEELEATIRVAANSRLHIAWFFLVTPFPNTPLYTYVAENMPEKLQDVSYDATDFWGARCNLSSVSDETLRYYHGMAYRKFYLQPRRIYRILRDYPKPIGLFREMSQFPGRALKGYRRHIPFIGSGKSADPGYPSCSK